MRGRSDAARMRSDGYLAPVTWTTADGAARVAERVFARLGGDHVEILRNAHLEHDWLREIVAADAVVDLVRAMIGDEVAVQNSFVMTKYPGETFEVPLHQDGINAAVELDHVRAVAVWLAVTEATEANGCLSVVPGSHSGGYLEYEVAGDVAPSRRGRPLRVRPDRQPDARAEVPIRLRPGEGCLLDVRTLHRSGSNSTDTPRIGVNVRYVAPGAFVRGSGRDPLMPLSPPKGG